MLVCQGMGKLTLKKKRQRNLAAKKVVKKAFRAAEAALQTKAVDVSEKIKKAVSVIDKAVERGIIHRNKAARKKSRLLLKFNQSRAQA